MADFFDDGGNVQIDFIWGNVPMQPNHEYHNDVDIRANLAEYPGDGFAEFILHHSPDGYSVSNQLEAKDSHVVALRHWNGFPEVNPDSGYNLTVNWWDVTPAAEFPNIVGKTLEDALKQYREIGVAENFLGDFLTNATNPYASGEGPDNGWLPNSGVVIWHYYEPDDVIGTHWDGSPWYAREAEGLVEYANGYPGEETAIGSYFFDGTNYITTSDPNQEGLAAPWWLTFSVIQTTDPNKNSWSWWN